MSGTIYSRGANKYSLVRRGHGYVLRYWCDCALGLHWHHLATPRTVEEADDIMDLHAEDAT